MAVLAYLLTSNAEPVPEISFPFFLQHMLYAGEVGGMVRRGLLNNVLILTSNPPHPPQVHHLVVNSERDRVYVYLHSGAIINGREVGTLTCHMTSL